MSRLGRKGLIVLLDTVLVNVAVISALLIRFETLPIEDWWMYGLTMVPLTAVRLLSNYGFGLYRRSWRYASVDEVIAITAAVSVGSLANVLILRYAFGFLPPRSVALLTWFLHIFLFGGSRFAWRLFRTRRNRFQSTEPEKNILIVGAGDGGVLVAREFRNHYANQFRVVGFIDDDPLKQNQQILGIPVLGGKDKLVNVVVEHDVDEIVISMPSVPRRTIRHIVELAQPTGKKIKILPGVFDLIDGNVTVQKIREVELEDLLGRDAVEADLAGMSAYIAGRVVLVTGGGGSIGSELCRQIVDFRPRRLLILDNCENNVYDVEMELLERSDVPIVTLVKDIRDERAVQKIFGTYRPEVVFHAAAHKHVPLMESNPEEAVKNNVYGTYVVAWAAHKHNVDKFVLVSTDKAVNPTSIMGASKRIAEMTIQYLDTISSTNYVAVRFGNVLGSRGSVIPLFRKQILAGGPVTVTHEEMIRYFMTIPEAVQLILQAGVLARGGEIFVLDMGEPVRILDLATTLIRLSGYRPYSDIDIQIVGMRAGEKLFEELLTAEEGVNATTHERIFVAKPIKLNTALLRQVLGAFSQNPAIVLPQDQVGTLRFIQQFLPRFELVTNAEPAAGEAAAAGTDFGSPGVLEGSQQFSED